MFVRTYTFGYWIFEVGINSYIYNAWFLILVFSQAIIPWDSKENKKKRRKNCWICLIYIEVCCALMYFCFLLWFHGETVNQKVFILFFLQSLYIMLYIIYYVRSYYETICHVISVVYTTHIYTRLERSEIDCVKEKRKIRQPFFELVLFNELLIELNVFFGFK